RRTVNGHDDGDFVRCAIDAEWNVDVAAVQAELDPKWRIFECRSAASVAHNRVELALRSGRERERESRDTVGVDRRLRKETAVEIERDTRNAASGINAHGQL